MRSFVFVWLALSAAFACSSDDEDATGGTSDAGADTSTGGSAAASDGGGQGGSTGGGSGGQPTSGGSAGSDASTSMDGTVPSGGQAGTAGEAGSAGAGAMGGAGGDDAGSTGGSGMGGTDGGTTGGTAGNTTGGTAGSTAGGTGGGDAGLEYTIYLCELFFPLNIDDAEGSVTTVYGRVYIAGLTDLTSSNDLALNVIASVGYGPDGSDPQNSTLWTWTSAVPNTAYGTGSPAHEPTKDEYRADLVTPSGSGSYDYRFRFSGDGGVTWTICEPAGDMTSS